MDSSKYSSIHYTEYLQLEKILNAQEMRSALDGNPAHDEMLFIVVHQVYELWFKQIIYEIQAIMKDLDDEQIDETSIGFAVRKLDRIQKILQLMIQQIHIIETMTPQDFLEFRDYLFPASGFQSFQFRKLEIILGLQSHERKNYNKKPFHFPFNDEQTKELQRLEKADSILELVEKWLERTPFLQFEGFDFIQQYRETLRKNFEKERQAVENETILEREAKDMRLKIIDESEKYYTAIIDKDEFERKKQEGEFKISYKAMLGALLIKLYDDEPILHLPSQFLSKLTDIDESMTTWRYRHAQMVLRMLGNKVGTGGSSGYNYLIKTVSHHQIFTDLHKISTLLIPKSDLPELPEHLKKALSFRFSQL